MSKFHASKFRFNPTTGTYSALMSTLFIEEWEIFEKIRLPERKPDTIGFYLIDGEKVRPFQADRCTMDPESSDEEVLYWNFKEVLLEHETRIPAIVKIQNL
jgi:hypothetical protein